MWPSATDSPPPDDQHAGLLFELAAGGAVEVVVGLDEAAGQGPAGPGTDGPGARRAAPTAGPTRTVSSTTSTVTATGGYLAGS